MYWVKPFLDKESLLALYYSYIEVKTKLKLTKTKYRISIKGPAIWNDFVEDGLKSIEITPFLVKMKCKLLNILKMT